MEEQVENISQGIKNKSIEKEVNNCFNVEEFLEDDNSIEANADNETTYSDTQEVYFAFIDALGFKETYDKDETSGRYGKVFSKFFDLLKESYFMEKNDQKVCYCGQTSDSLYFYTNDIQSLFGFIQFYLYFNCLAMEEKVFFRGGIAKGDIRYKEKYQFFGDSVIKAYTMESTMAGYPIVVIDESTYADLKSYEGDLSAYITEQDNGRKRLNLFMENMNLRTVFKNYADKTINYEKIKENICNSLNCNEYNDKVYKKYHFLKKEYNAFFKEETKR